MANVCIRPTVLMRVGPHIIFAVGLAFVLTGIIDIFAVGSAGICIEMIVIGLVFVTSMAGYTRNKIVISADLVTIYRAFRKSIVIDRATPAHVQIVSFMRMPGPSLYPLISYLHDGQTTHVPLKGLAVYATPRGRARANEMLALIDAAFRSHVGSRVGVNPEAPNPF